MAQSLASSRSASDPAAASTTSSTSIPTGSASSRATRTASGSTRSLTASSTYSASLAVPVGAAFAYEIRGCGWNPALNAIGTSARRRARSSARWKSRVEEKRSRPRLA